MCWSYLEIIQRVNGFISGVPYPYFQNLIVGSTSVLRESLVVFVFKGGIVLSHALCKPPESHRLSVSESHTLF